MHLSLQSPALQHMLTVAQPNANHDTCRSHFGALTSHFATPLHAHTPLVVRCFAEVSWHAASARPSPSRPKHSAANHREGAAVKSWRAGSESAAPCARAERGSKAVYREVMQAVETAERDRQSSPANVRPSFSFIYSPSGCGKTFTFNIMLAKVRSQGGIALAVASSLRHRCLAAGRRIQA